jgi:lysophospholipase L1-like esterase
MARLPTPGGDSGTWGTVLNTYLQVAHNSDGTLKNSGILAQKYTKPSTGIPESDLSASVQTKLATAANPSDATTTSKGIVQLAGDLSGTATAPTVPGLSTKANDSIVVHLAGSETITGAKNFTGGLQISGQTAVATNDSRLSDQRTPSDDSVSTAKLQDHAITTDKIGDGQVTAAKVAADVATQAELDAHVAATDPHTVYWNSNRGGKAIQRENLMAMRNFHAAVANMLGGAASSVDVLLVGDSISEGWFGSTTWSSTYAGRTAQVLGLAINSGGRIGRGWVPGGNGWYSLPKFSTVGANTETSHGMSLRGRQLASGDYTEITVDNCDRFVVQYRRAAIFAQADIVFTIDGVERAQIATYDNSLAAFATEVHQWDSGQLSRGTHTLRVTNRANGGFNGIIYFDGAYAFDGEYSTGVRFWNCSHFGFTTNQYVSNYGNALWWGRAIERGYVKPGLVVIALGTNDKGIMNATQYHDNLSTMIDNIRSACTTGGMSFGPSIAVSVPFSNGGMSSSAWEAYRDQVYLLQQEKGIAVFEWAEAMGNTNSVDGDSLGLTSDSTHPNNKGQALTGTWLPAKILHGFDAGAMAANNAAKKIDNGLRSASLLGNMGASKTLDASTVSAFTGTLNSATCTLSISGAIAGMETKLTLTLIQDATGSRLVTWPSGTRWPGGTAPTLSTSANAADMVELISYDGGTIWYGRLLGAGFA